jgi:hypothetical protein
LKNETTEPAREAARELEAERFIAWVPPIKIAGRELTGQSYDRLIKQRVDGQPPITPQEFAEAADQIPKDFLRRVRGLVRLLWVNGYFRQAETTEDRVTSLLAQWAYSFIMRGEGWIEFTTAAEYAKEQIRNPFKTLLLAGEMAYNETLRRKLGILVDKGFLEERDSRFRVEDAVFPQIAFEITE